MADPRITITVYRSTLTDAITALELISTSSVPNGLRHAASAALEELADAFREADPASGGVVEPSGPLLHSDLVDFDAGIGDGGPVARAERKPTRGPLTAEEAAPDCGLPPLAETMRTAFDAIERAPYVADPPPILTHRSAEVYNREMAKVRRQHDPDALMKEPDLYEQGEGGGQRG